MELHFWNSCYQLGQGISSFFATQGPHLSTKKGLGKLWGPIQPLTTSDSYVWRPWRSYRKTHTKTQQILSSVSIWIRLICLLPCSLKTRDSQVKKEMQAGLCMPWGGGAQGRLVSLGLRVTDGVRYMSAEAYHLQRDRYISPWESPQYSSPKLIFDWRKLPATLCWLLSAVHQHESAIGIHVPLPSLLQVVTEPRAEILESHSKFPLAVVHVVAYMLPW